MPVLPRVILLQHGEKLRGTGDVPLTPRGHRQAEAAAAALTPLRPSLLVTSPMLRARQTLAPLAAALSTSPRVDDRARERMNLEHTDDPGVFFAAWAATCEDRDLVTPFGDSSRACGARVLACVEECATASALSVVATHGGATVDLLRTLLRDDGLERCCPGMAEHGVPGGALTTLERSRTGWRVLAVADLAHVPEGLRTGHRP